MDMTRSPSSLWDMLRLKSDRFVHLMRNLGVLEGLMLPKRGPGIQTRSADRIVVDNRMRKEASELISLLDELELTFSRKEAERFSSAIAGESIEIERGFAMVQELQSRVQDELSEAYVLTLSTQEHRLVEPPTFPFGPDVEGQFPSVISEVVSGSKCLGFGLPTASVFHYIRCLEAGIAAMSRCLGIDDPTKGSDRSWMKLLGKIKAAIDTKWPPGQIRLGDAQFFEEAHALLAAIQNPYRNATMHLDQRYDVSEAEHIKAMVEGFMRKLSSRMDENGLPLA